MREFRGAMPRISNASLSVFRFLQKNYCVLKPYSEREMKALHLHNLRPCVIVVFFLKKNYCKLKLNRSRLSAKKNLIVATEKETYAIDLNNGDVAQMIERSRRMREVRGSMPRISNTSDNP